MDVMKRANEIMHQMAEEIAAGTNVWRIIYDEESEIVEWFRDDDPMPMMGMSREYIRIMPWFRDVIGEELGWKNGWWDEGVP